MAGSRPTAEASAALFAELRAARRAVDQEVGEARRVAADGKRAEAEVASLKAQVELHERVLAVLASISEARQESARRQVEELVTRGLQTIFGEELSFRLIESDRAGQPQLDFIIRSEYGADAPLLVDTPVLEARGGGMAVVVAFMLRLVVLLLTPGARRVMLLDESFAHVSAEYEPRVAEFLREVADKAGVQVFMITHSDAYHDAADVRHRLRLGADGVTQLEEA